MIDPSAVAAARVAIAKAGVCVTFQRNIGFAAGGGADVTSLTVALVAVVRAMLPDATSPAQDGLRAPTPGALNQNQRWVLLMAQDLIDGGVALPVQRGDQIAVPETG